MNEPEIGLLLGQTATKISGAEKGSDEILFRLADGRTFKMFHGQDCCEQVDIEDIIGDVNDLIGMPFTMAEEVTHQDETPDGVDPPEHPDSYTWTFYKLATVKGYVTIRWLGESNGYYSESVDFVEVKS